MTAQVGDYLGPGILSRGAGDIGTRAGQDVDLRFFVNASAIYDNGIQPYSVDGKGQLVTVNGLYGVETSLGTYGVHKFQHAQLGLDYRGTYRHYSQQSFYDGSDHTLVLGYTYQKSARLIFDTRHMAGSVSQGTPFGSVLSSVPESIVTQSSVLFDNRMNYLQSSLDVNYRLSEHTTLSVGGDGFGVWRKATGLIGTQGYILRGSVQHRLSARATLQVTYQHLHFDFPKAFGESDVNGFLGTFASQLSRNWTVNLSAGAYLAEVQGLQRVAVAPEIAALLGTSVSIQTFYRKSVFPQWSGGLTRQFHRASLTVGYENGVSAGNGVYLTSRAQTGRGSFSYTATRKWSFSINGAYSRLQGIGQGLAPFSQVAGGADMTYSLTRPIQLFAQYERRHQEVIDSVYLRNSYRASIGISFSPGDIPLAFH